MPIVNELKKEITEQSARTFPDFDTAYIQTPGKIATGMLAQLYGIKPQSAYVMVFQRGLRQKRQEYWKNIVGDKQSALKEKISQCYDQALEGWEDLYIRIQTAMEDPSLKPSDIGMLAGALDKYTRHMQALNQTYGDGRKYESLYSHIGQEESEKE